MCIRKIDSILGTMDPEKRESLKKNLLKYKSDGDPAAKAAVLRIIREYDDNEAIRNFINEL